MPALMLRLHSPSPVLAPAFRLNCQTSAKRTERCRWSSPNGDDGRSFPKFPRSHLLFLLDPWCPSIRTAKGRVADDRVLALSLNQPLAVFRNEQATRVRL